MSTASRNTSSRRATTRRPQVSRDDLLQYVLRAALVTVKLQSKPKSRSTAPNSTRRPNGTPNGHSRQHSTAIMPSAMSIGDILGLGAKKSAKFPKELIKLLESTLERVVMRQEPQYDDMLIRSTFAVFYSYYKSDAFMRTIKDSRRVEDLILMFVSKATGELAKRNPDSDIKPIVNQHLMKFVRLIIQIVRNNGLASNSSELIQNLTTYEQKLRQNDEILAPASLTSPAASAPPSPEPIKISVKDSVNLQTIAAVFAMGPGTLQAEVDIAESRCTDKRLIRDLKNLVELIHLQAPPCYRSLDFETQEAYQAWRDAELSSLTQDIIALTTLNPSLAGEAKDDDLESITSNMTRLRSSSESPQPATLSKRTSFASERSVGTGTELDATGSLFFVPPEPLLYYRELVSLVIQEKLLQTMELEESSEGGLVNLLGRPGQAMLLECRKYWRITSAGHKASVLESVKNLYLENRLSLQFLDDVFLELKEQRPDTPEENSSGGFDYTMWTRQDREIQLRSLTQLNDSIMRELYAELQDVYVRTEIDLSAAVVLQEHIHADPICQESLAELGHTLADFERSLHDAAKDAYRRRKKKLPADPELTVPDITALLKALVDDGKRLRRRYKVAILDRVKVPTIFITEAIPALLNDLLPHLTACHTNAQDSGLDLAKEDMLDLYRQVIEAEELVHKCSKSWKSPIVKDKVFRAYIVRWLEAADESIMDLVRRSLESDDFSVDPAFNADGEVRSHSIIMVLRSCNQHFTFLRDLRWQHEYWHARFMTELAKIFSNAIRLYCSEVERLFEQDMSLRAPSTTSSDASEDSSSTLQQRLYARAREALSRKEQVEPFSISPQACVKLNNIEWAKEQLDKLEQLMNTEQLGRTIESFEGKRPLWVAGEKAIFTIKVIEGLDIKPFDRDGTSNPYLVLSDQKGKRVGKTRTMAKTTTPRWNDTFEVAALEPLWLSATVWNRNAWEHDICGRCYFRLDPRVFEDFLPKSFHMPLDQQGYIHLRISMEAELDDSGYYFGRAFKSLSMTEAVMARTIVEKMEPLITATLSHQTLRSFFGKALDNTLETAYSLLNRAGIANNRLPAIQRSAPSAPVTKQEIEAPVEPLLNFLDGNFKTLDETLSRSAFIKVMEMLWAFVLLTIEDLIVPPLTSDRRRLTAARVLSEQELDIVYKWLSFLKDTFHGDGGGLEEEQLQTPLYHETVSIRFFYFDDEVQLMDECRRTSASVATKAAELRKTQLKRGLTHSGTTFRNLGTMRQQRAERLAQKRQISNNEEVILRVLQLRGSSDARNFVHDRIQQRLKEQEKAVSATVVRQHSVAAPPSPARRMSGR